LGLFCPIQQLCTFSIPVDSSCCGAAALSGASAIEFGFWQSRNDTRYHAEVTTSY
jgi:hypothetical protein